MPGSGFDNSRIGWLFGQGVKASQMAACAIKEEAQDLFEQLHKGDTLAAFAHGAEHTLNMREQLDTQKVFDKKIEPGSSCQKIIGNLNVVNGVCGFVLHWLVFTRWVKLFLFMT